MKTDFTRRAATEADKEFARQTHHRAYRDVVVRQFGPWDEQRQNQFFENTWSQLPHEILELGGVPCGYTVVEERSDDVHIHELVVDPEFQGRGIGTDVLTEVMNQARARGVPVTLQTQRENIRAADLYRKLGFRGVGETENHLLFEWP